MPPSTASPTAILQSYLQSLHATRATGAAVAETSFYDALSTLLNQVGATLRPVVRCVLTLRNQGAGLPDGGLFTADQLGDADPTPGQLPARGAVEVKGTADDLDALARSAQVARYLDRYGLVLATTYRAFALVGKDAAGRPTVLNRYDLALDEATFWQATRQPAATVATHGAPFVAFLQRAMQVSAPLTDPADVAWFLASYAREALARVESHNLAALAALREALEGALGIHFTEARGQHFFCSTLVQTLFYGLFSAWVLWQRNPGTRSGIFDWRSASWHIHVPMLQALFADIAQPQKLGPLGLVPILDRAAATLARVKSESFFARFEETQAVQYFYEPFLEHFDPVLRQQLGVWYTPPEIVRYMVERVDQVLREELGLAAGLADERVILLDPACGTGAYLVEVLRRIARTLGEQGEEALGAVALQQAVTQRLIGFELLPASLVVAHLQVGLLLQQYGAPLEEQQRAAIFLTNALTGWDEQFQTELDLPPYLKAEHDAAEQVKQQTKILVVIGNPPYYGFAGIATGEERGLTHAYRETVRSQNPAKGQGLNELYVRFFRIAEREIVEDTGRGVICFITNSSWLDGQSHPGMRERFLSVFDSIWIDNLHGDKYRTGKVTPWGEPDPSAFSTEQNREGIGLGTAVALLVRRTAHQGTEQIAYREWWGRGKRAALLASLGAPHEHPYESLVPTAEMDFRFLPTQLGSDYLDWPLLPELFPISFPGVKTARDEVLVDIDRATLEGRMRRYFDMAITDEEITSQAPLLMKPVKGFEPVATRRQLQQRGFSPANLVRYYYRPLDVRWLYWEMETKLVDRARPEYQPHLFTGNLWLAATQRNRRAFDPPTVTSEVASYHVIERATLLFPLYLAHQAPLDLFAAADAAHATGPLAPTPNLSPLARTYLDRLSASPELLFYHTLATLHAPAYRLENEGALLQDWPRVPLPATVEALTASAELGRQVAALLDPAQPVPSVTTHPLADDLRGLGAPASATGRALRGADFALTAGWGYAGREGITMPGRGRVVERSYTADERAQIADGALARGLTPEQALAALGDEAVDVYLNEEAYWGNIPTRVWGYTLGGYQVLKKWLSYREEALLGRALTIDEVRYVAEMVRRVAALLFLEMALDGNYARARATL